MLDINEPLRIVYFTALSGIVYNSVPIQVFSPQLPSTIAPGIYIIIGPIIDTNDNLKTSFQHESLVPVSIYTNSLQYNDGAAVNAVAQEVMQRIWPYTRFNITLPNGLKCTITQKDSDTTSDFSIQNQNTYIDRTITFRHLIFENVS